jgi:hypothetical protein
MSIYTLILKSKPTTRQIQKLLDSHVTLVLDISSSHQSDCIDSLHRMGLQPIVLLNSDIYTLFKRTEQRGTPMMGDSWDRLPCILTRQEIPFVSLWGIEKNKRIQQTIPDALRNVCKGLHEQGIVPTRFVVLNDTGGLGTRFVSLAQSHPTTEIMQYMSMVLNPLGPTCTGILAHHSDVDRFVATLVTEKPPLRSDSLCRAPTLFRSHIHISVHHNTNHIDRDQIRHVLQGAFGKPVPDSYLDSLGTKTLVIAKTESMYLGVSILEPGVVPYLDKFAIVKEAQGLGIAEMMWEHVVESGSVFWRARASNKANGWYFEKSDGTIRFQLQQEWILFWVGPVDVERCLETVKSLPSTFG